MTMSKTAALALLRQTRKKVLGNRRHNLRWLYEARTSHGYQFDYRGTHPDALYPYELCSASDVAASGITGSEILAVTIISNYAGEVGDIVESLHLSLPLQSYVGKEAVSAEPFPENLPPAPHNEDLPGDIIETVDPQSGRVSEVSASWAQWAVSTGLYITWGCRRDGPYIITTIEKVPEPVTEASREA